MDVTDVTDVMDVTDVTGVMAGGAQVLYGGMVPSSIRARRRVRQWS